MRLILTTLALAALFPSPALLHAETAEAAPENNGPNVEVVESDEEISLPAPTAENTPAPEANEDEAPSPSIVTAETALTAEEISASIKSDGISIPTPGELMAALSKEAQPNWQSRYRPPIPTTYTSRAQIALNIGGLIADGYIALQAKDSQQIKNIGKDIITLAKSLAVGENVIARGNSIIDFADNSQWGALQEELEATQNEVKLALQEQRDTDLITLVTIGGWLRGTAILSSFVEEHYSEPAARLLRQPGVVSYMRTKIDALPERMRSEKIVKNVDKKLAQMETLVTFSHETTPSLEDVTTLKTLSEGLVEDISSKEDK